MGRIIQSLNDAGQLIVQHQQPLHSKDPCLSGCGHRSKGAEGRAHVCKQTRSERSMHTQAQLRAREKVKSSEKGRK